MFRFPGKKIKDLAEAVFFINIILSVLLSLLCMMFLVNPPVVLNTRLFQPLNYGIAIAVAGILFVFNFVAAYMLNLVLYSYGQLVDNTDFLRAKYEKSADDVEDEDEVAAEADYKEKDNNIDPSVFPGRSSGEILYNLNSNFKYALTIEDDDKMIAYLSDTADILPPEEQGIIRGIIKNPADKVREIMNDVLRKNAWVENEANRMGHGL